jgi:hypothetical protein
MRWVASKLIMTALWTEACLTFPVLDAIQEGYEVYVPVDAVGGTSLAAHEAALRRMEQAGAKLISRVQMYCELQRDWSREVDCCLASWVCLKTSTASMLRRRSRKRATRPDQPAVVEGGAGDSWRGLHFWLVFNAAK